MREPGRLRPDVLRTLHTFARGWQRDVDTHADVVSSVMGQALLEMPNENRFFRLDREEGAGRPLRTARHGDLSALASCQEAPQGAFPTSGVAGQHPAQSRCRSNPIAFGEVRS